MSADRKTVRDALKVLLEAALTGAGAPVQAVHAAQLPHFEGQSPVVVVWSAGSRRERLTFQGGKTTFYVNVDLFVRYSDPAAGWDEQDAEDALDTIERLVAEVAEYNQRTATWETLDYADRSVADSVLLIDGTEYRRETIPLAATVFA